MNRAGGSFRDPEGHVFIASDRVFRGIAHQASDRLRAFLRSDFFRERTGAHIVETREVAPEVAMEAGVPESEVGAWAMWVEHETLPLITYPYEWPFECLKQAACLTLDLLGDALRNGYTLKDASAFNVQFINSRPIFIDVLSFTEYEEGAPFLGYKQFCEQFFAPLCLTAFAGIEFNQWFRGRLDGLDLIEASRALPLTTRCRPQVLMHIHFPGVGDAETEVRVRARADGRQTAPDSASEPDRARRQPPAVHRRIGTRRGNLLAEIRCP